MQQIPISPVQLTAIQKKLYQQKKVQAHVLRLDAMHPVISGNKWFKLKGYLQQAHEENKKCILTFGGAFSNHIVATAAACRQHGFLSVGIIRGEASEQLSPTLAEATRYGMQLYFISRVAYKEKRIPPAVYQQHQESDVFVIGEGGYGLPGKYGAMDILKSVPTQQFTHILAAVGTGTMLAGLAEAALPHQQVIGISALKNHTALEQEVNNLLQKPATFSIVHTYHFGGYAKHTPALLQFMNDWYTETGIPSDFVYTAKLFYAVDDLISNGYFKAGDSLLIIHSGGLQGNRSLPNGTLIF